MRKLALLLIVILLDTTCIFAFRSINKKVVTETESANKRSGVAVIMTGAAARITQEAALLEELDRRGLLKNLVFISGVSSGALNAVALNGILSKKMSWSEYKETLFALKNSDIFKLSNKKIPVDTSPARALYTKIFVDRLGYKKIGDLPFTTEISFTHLSDLSLKKTVYRMCSKKINEESDPSLSLVDIAMASSAFPVFFPSVKIENVKTIPDVNYVDGGIGDDHIPFQALLEFEKFRGQGVEKVYIISRKSDNIPEVSEELNGLGIDDKGIFDRLGISMDAFLRKDFIKSLKNYTQKAPELVSNTYVWIPEFNEDFLLFDFENMKKQYTLTTEWAKTHHPVLLNNYLSSLVNEKLFNP